MHITLHLHCTLHYTLHYTSHCTLYITLHIAQHFAHLLQSFKELEDIIQIWVESYNTYHLLDGAAMKEVWGSIMPHIVLSERNLARILAQVEWAVAEDAADGAILSPRQRRLRLHGGAQEMIMGYNTEHLLSAPTETP